MIARTCEVEIVLEKIVRHLPLVLLAASGAALASNQPWISDVALCKAGIAVATAADPMTMKAQNYDGTLLVSYTSDKPHAYKCWIEGDRIFWDFTDRPGRGPPDSHVTYLIRGTTVHVWNRFSGRRGKHSYTLDALHQLGLRN